MSRGYSSLEPGPDQKVADFLRSWLADVAKHTVRPSTLESYKRHVEVHVVPHFGKLKLSKLTAQRLQGFYSRMLAEGLSPSTVQKQHSIIHRALDQAMRWDLVARNVADLVDAPRAVRREMKPLAAEQTARFLEVARDDRLHALYVLAVSTGLRQGELLGLGWADVDLEGAVIQVHRQLVRAKGEGFTFSGPETAKGRRSVTLPAFAVAALREHRARQIVESALAGPEWTETGLVFTNGVGKPLERQNVLRRSFEPILAAAGCPRIRFHDLRHTSASLLLLQGEHPKVIQERLGHSTIAVTMDVYSHVSPSMQRGAADRPGPRVSVGLRPVSRLTL